MPDIKEQLTIEYVPLAELEKHKHPENPKDHAIADLIAGFERFGFATAITVDDRTAYIAAGHGRLEALQTMRINGERAPSGVITDAKDWRAPVIRGWSSEDDEELLAYVISDNRQTELGGWKDNLPRLLERLQKTSAGLVGTGYTVPDLKGLLARLKGSPTVVGDPEDVPDLPVVALTQAGDLWSLGDHRLLCGDATQSADYVQLLGKGVVDLVVSDPPYGVDIGSKNRTLDSLDKGSGRVTTDLEGDGGIEEVEKLWRDSFGPLAALMPPGCPYYVFGPQGGDLGLLLLLLLRDAGLSPRHILIWVKNRASFSIGRLDYDYQHEPIVYGWKPGAAHSWFGSELQQTSVLEFDRPARSPDHPTVKPVALLERLIVNSAQAKGIVLDPFGGSGSTMIAAHLTGRIAYLLEIDRGYCDVIVRRWVATTGQDAVRQDGAKWSELAP